MLFLQKLIKEFLYRAKIECKVNLKGESYGFETPHYTIGTSFIRIRLEVAASLIT